MGSNFKGIGQENYGKGYREKGLDYFLQKGLVQADVQGAAQGIMNKATGDTTSLGTADTIKGQELVTHLESGRDSIVDLISSGKSLDNSDIKSLLTLQKQTKEVDQQLAKGIRGEAERKQKEAKLDNLILTSTDPGYYQKVKENSSKNYHGVLGPDGADYQIDPTAPGAVDVDSWIGGILKTASASMALDDSGSALADIIRVPVRDNNNNLVMDTYGQQVYAYKTKKSMDQYSNAAALTSALNLLNSDIQNPDSKVNKYVKYMGLNSNALQHKVALSVGSYQKNQLSPGGEAFIPITNPNPNSNKGKNISTKYKQLTGTMNTYEYSTGRPNYEPGTNVGGKSSEVNTPEYGNDRYTRDFSGTELEYKTPKSYYDKYSRLHGTPSEGFPKPGAIEEAVLKGRYNKYMGYMLDVDNPEKQKIGKDWFVREGYGLKDADGNTIPLHKTTEYIKDYNTHTSNITGIGVSPTNKNKSSGVVKLLNKVISGSGRGAIEDTGNVYMNYLTGFSDRGKINAEAIKFKHYISLHPDVEISTFAPLPGDSEEVAAFKSNMTGYLEGNYKAYHDANKQLMLTIPIKPNIGYSTYGGEVKTLGKKLIAEITTNIKNSIGSRKILVFDKDLKQIGTSVTKSKDDDKAAGIYNGSDAQDLVSDFMPITGKGPSGEDSIDYRAKMLGVMQPGTDIAGLATISTENFTPDQITKFNKAFESPLVLQDRTTGMYVVVEGRNAYNNGNDLGYDLSIPTRDIQVEGYEINDFSTTLNSRLSTIKRGDSNVFELPLRGSNARIKAEVTRRPDGMYTMRMFRKVNIDGEILEVPMVGSFTKEVKQGVYKDEVFENKADLLATASIKLRETEQAMLQSRNGAKAQEIESELNN